MLLTHYKTGHKLHVPIKTYAYAIEPESGKTDIHLVDGTVYRVTESAETIQKEFEIETECY